MTPRLKSPRYPGETIAEQKRKAQAIPYNPTPLLTRINELMKERNLSARGLALLAGLDHQAIRRLRVVKSRPDMATCILLADCFELNPNEFLQLAGWPTLRAFEIKTATATVAQEAVAVALSVSRIADPKRRQQVADAMKALADLFASG